MGTSWLARHRRRIAISLLEVTLAIGAAVVLLGAVPELARIGLGGPFAESPGAPSATTPSLIGQDARVPIMVAMPSDADCRACHLDATGGVNTKPIPPLGHPLEGWRECTACHANDRLVQIAPGHSSLHKEDCLVCHSVPAPGGSPPPRPHHVITDATCVSCHGKTAPLPTDMAGRQNCWICHVGTEFDQLFGGTPAPTVLPLPSSP